VAIRISAGIYKNRKLKSPHGKALRPLSGRIKEALFSILAKRIPGCIFLDVFAGTGSVGLEALSRGAAQALFVEKDPAAVKILRENISLLNIEHETRVFNIDFFNFTTELKPGIVFAGPPYKQNLGTKILKHLREKGMTFPDTVLALQRHYKEHVDCGGYERLDSRKYGISAIDFFKLEKKDSV
jgi:16S rRNA (guanine966-N2)-methyltransferase